MKIARFSHEGAIAFGIVDDDELVVLEKDPMFAGFGTTGERLAVSSVKLLSPVIPRSKVVVMGSDFFASAAAEAEAEVRLRVPAGWPEPAPQQASLHAHGGATLLFEVVAGSRPARRARVAAELTVDGHRFGQQAEALVDVG